MIPAMRKTTFILLIAMAIGGTAMAEEFPTFMTGSWALSYDGTVVEEHWTDAKGNLMVGMNRTAKAAGKPSFEFLRIEKRDGKLAYVAMPGGGAPTAFPLKSLTASKVVFENLGHDFPQRIIYWRDKNKLCARVEGNMGGKDGGGEWCWAKAE